MRKESTLSTPQPYQKLVEDRCEIEDEIEKMVMDY